MATDAAPPSPHPQHGSGFDYGRAFSRNVGWVTAAEQEALRGARVAVAGLGGVGGSLQQLLLKLIRPKVGVA